MMLEYYGCIDFAELVGCSKSKSIRIMTYARNNGYIVLTCDLDFSAILSIIHGKKPSVIQLRMQGIESEQIAKYREEGFFVGFEDWFKD
jgi:predicted nuclease of predicted toxin-antitoxin system